MLDSKQVFGILRGIQDMGASFVEVINPQTRKNKSFILLSMIRNNRVEDFFNILLNLYMSVNRPVPDALVDLLNTQDIIGFQTKAYAFMSGFLGEQGAKQVPHQKSRQQA